MQGPIWSKTYTTAESYLTLAWVNRVIISTWEGQKSWDTNYRISVIKSKDVTNPGGNNRNRQLFSSQIGVNVCTADLIMKTRTDQQIDIPSMKKMYDYFMKHYKIDKKFLDGTGPKGAIFTIGLYSGYVFHPQDHLFLGFREDIQKLFDLPLDPDVPPDPKNPTDLYGSSFTHNATRPNAYLGMYYYARFDEQIKYMVEHYRDFIVDQAPGRAEAFAAEAPYRDVIFKAFPRINLWWEKYNQPYPYEVGHGYSEYCGKEW